MLVTIEEAFSVLAGFQTADEIAEYLRLNGIKGYRMDDRSCPIAAFMSSRTGKDISVGTRRILNIMDEPENYGLCLDGEEGPGLEMTEAMRLFIDKFDGYDYEELVLELEYS